MADEPLVTVAEIEAEAQWRVPVDGAAVVSDWANRAAVPASVAAELFTRAVAERDRLAFERQERLVAEVAKWRTPPPVADEYLTALADESMARNRG